MTEKIKKFRRKIWEHYRAHGRDLPWRRTKDPYRILVSEIMLQQTQVERVLPKYDLFIKRFPDFRALGEAPTKDVLAAWQGLGYNRRALYLKRITEAVLKNYGGKLPRSPELLQTLPGIGAGTAGAITAFAFDSPSVFVETNIRRACIHFFFKRKRKVDDAEIIGTLKRACALQFPRGRSWREWYWALMDYGAALGSSRTIKNPNRKSAQYGKQSPFKGSNRELRGNIVKLLLRKRIFRERDLIATVSQPRGRVRAVLAALAEEGLITKRAGAVSIAK